jgi:hypothetical protein
MGNDLIVVHRYTLEELADRPGRPARVRNRFVAALTVKQRGNSESVGRNQRGNQVARRSLRTEKEQ